MQECSKSSVNMQKNLHFSHMSLKAGGGGLNTLADMSAKSVYFVQWRVSYIQFEVC